MPCALGVTSVQSHAHASAVCPNPCSSQIVGLVYKPAVAAMNPFCGRTFFQLMAMFLHHYLQNSAVLPSHCTFGVISGIARLSANTTNTTKTTDTIDTPNRYGTHTQGRTVGYVIITIIIIVVGALLKCNNNNNNNHILSWIRTNNDLFKAAIVDSRL